MHTDTHPGFTTDWQQPLLVLMSQADGMSVLHETVFENRFVYVQALQQMGCEIELFPACLGGNACRFHDTNSLHSAVVRGASKLRRRRGHVPDVRAGYSSVIAAVDRRQTRRCCTACTTSSAATTVRSSSSPRSVCASPATTPDR